MPFTLRLSPYLEAEARQRAELLGISLNSLISVALDLHLRSYHSATSENAPTTTSIAPAAAPVAAPIASVQAMPESRPVVVHSPPPPVNSVAKAVVEPQKPPVQVFARPQSPATPPFNPKPSLLGSDGNHDPKPVLPPKPSKRDRQLLAQWYARNPKNKA